MALSQHIFSDALRDMQRAMAVFDHHPFFNPSRTGNAWLTQAPATTAWLSGLDENASTGPLASASRYPVADLKETPAGYELVAEIPGYDKKDIKIEMPDSRTLVLSGFKKEQNEVTNKPASDASTEAAHEAKKEDREQEQQSSANRESGDDAHKKKDERSTWWVRERVSGSFTRSFTFPQPITAEEIKASFDNGLLKVTIPKVTQKQPKQINID